MKTTILPDRPAGKEVSEQLAFQIADVLDMPLDTALLRQLDRPVSQLIRPTTIASVSPIKQTQLHVAVREQLKKGVVE